MKNSYANKLVIVAFTLPALVLFTLFIIYPLIPTIIYSLFNYDGFKTNGFVGFSNYKLVLADSVFWNSNLNNLKIILAQTLIATPLSFLLAILVAERGETVKRFFKTSSFIPAVLSITVICQMFIMILQPDWGILDRMLKALGLGQHIRAWLSDPKTALWAVTITFIWQFIGFNMMLFYSGLKSIPEKYYEAAYIEGAGFFQRSIYITIPLLQEVVKFVLILTITGCLGMFGQVSIMTNGGPGDITRTTVYHLYYTAFSLSDYGAGNAIAVIFAIEGMAVIAFLNRFVARYRVEYN